MKQTYQIYDCTCGGMPSFYYHLLSGVYFFVFKCCDFNQWEDKLTKVNVNKYNKCIKMHLDSQNKKFSMKLKLKKRKYI